MATPRGAEHRDLEQKFRSIENRVRELATVAMRRTQLNVTEGDFVVSGGGSVVVQDGGGVTADESGLFTSIGATARATMAAGIVKVTTMADGVATAPDVTHFKDRITFNAGVGALTEVVSTEPGVGRLTGTEWRINHPTTSAPANAVLDAATMVLARSTSSRRYKQDEQPHTVDPAAVLAMQPTSWRDRAEVAADPDTTRRHVGFIAEDLHDAGLSEFVTYDDEGRPDAIAYDRLSVGLLAVVQDLAGRMERLESGRTR